METISSNSLPNRSAKIFLTVIVVLVILILLSITEYALRSILEEEPLGLLMPNPTQSGSYRLKPNASLSTKINNKDVLFVTNSFGMRNPEISMEKQEGVRRVAFLGDSFTFGLWATSDEASYVGTVRKAFKGASVEVLNFGVGGYGLDDMHLLLKEVVSGFEPDFVVVGIFTGNDFRDTYLGLDKYLIQPNGTSDWNNQVVDAKIPEEYRKRKKRADPVDHFLRKFEIINIFRSIFEDSQNGVAKKLEYIDVDETRFKSYTFWSQSDYPSVANAAVDLSLSQLNSINQWACMNDATLLVVSIPYREQVYVEHLSSKRYDAARPQVFVEDFASRKNIGYLDLLPALRKIVQEEGLELYERGDIHFSNLGHKKAGEIISTWIQGEISEVSTKPKCKQ